MGHCRPGPVVCSPASASRPRTLVVCLVLLTYRALVSPGGLAAAVDGRTTVSLMYLRRLRLHIPTRVRHTIVVKTTTLLSRFHPFSRHRQARCPRHPAISTLCQAIHPRHGLHAQLRMGRVRLCLLSPTRALAHTGQRPRSR